MERKNIAILGANGQVGSELCLLLSLSSSVRPLGVSRSEYGLALLRKLDIDCRVATTDKQLSEVLAEADAVVDLVHPWQADTRQMRRSIVERVQLLCGGLPVQSPIIYASTISVYRIDPGRGKYTIYGNTKLFAERELARACKRSGHALYVQRFGQVHGAMQGCSLSVQQQLSDGRKFIVPNIPSFTVFVSTISEAVEQIVHGNVEPGTYTMISDPPWTYNELLEWLARDVGVTVDVTVSNEPLNSACPSVIGGLKSIGARLAMHHKELLSDIGARYAPLHLERYKQNHRARIAAAQTQDYETSLCTPLFSQKVSITGPRIPRLRDPRLSMPPLHREVKQMLARLTE